MKNSFAAAAVIVRMDLFDRLFVILLCLHPMICAADEMR